MGERRLSINPFRPHLDRIVACLISSGRPIVGYPVPGGGDYNKPPGYHHQPTPRPRFWHNAAMDMKIFQKRRATLMSHMGGGVAILPTAPVRVRNRDVHYPYRAD